MGGTGAGTASAARRGQKAHDNSELSAENLRAYLVERLSGFKIPKRIVFAEEIPKSAAGKVQRYKLAESFDIKIGPK